MMLLFLFLIGYCVGSISIGFIVARLKGISDIRAHGSGSSGATNVARHLGISYFFLIFFLDFFKAYFLIALVQWYGLGDWHQCAMSMGLLIGNGYPLFLQFKGGKLVSTSCGIISAMNMQLMVPLCITWLIVFLQSRTVGFASVVTFVVLPLYAVWFAHSLSMHFLTSSICLLGLWLHRANIRQLITKIAFVRR